MVVIKSRRNVSCKIIRPTAPCLIMLIVGILYFISFCVDGVGSVLNDTHFVSCYDRSYMF